MGSTIGEIHTDVLVVGGGPAGLAAAIAAVEAGAWTLVVERGGRLGGVLNQCIHDGFGVIEYGERLTGPEYAHRQKTVLHSRELDGIGDRAAALRSSDGQGGRGGIGVRTDVYLHTLTQTNGEWSATIISPSGVGPVRARSVVMATGCRERTDRQIYLHGDRPAGIFTAGQAQRLINIDGAMPGRNIVILGSGDIGLIMARRFVLEGANVLGVYELQPEVSGLARNVAQCLEDWGIPLHLQTTVTEVHGRDRVEAVTVCPVDDQGLPVPGAGHEVACDTLILSVGLIPENDLIAELGVALDPTTGGPAVTQERETELPGLFVCGNALHVYDLVDYVSECGRAAGAAAARHAAARDTTVNRWTGDAIPVVGTGNVHHLVPQKLIPVPNEAPAFFLRVRGPAERARLTVSRRDLVVSERRLNYLRPPEMVRHAISAADWDALLRGSGPIVVTLEDLDGR